MQVVGKFLVNFKGFFTHLLGKIGKLNITAEISKAFKFLKTPATRFAPVFDSTSVCAGTWDAGSGSQYESQLTSWHPDCSAFIGDKCGKIPINQTRYCTFYEQNDATDQCVQKNTTNVKMSWHLNCPFEDGKARFKKITLCDPDATGNSIRIPWLFVNQESYHNY